MHILCLYVDDVWSCVSVALRALGDALERSIDLTDRFRSQISCKLAEPCRSAGRADILRCPWTHVYSARDVTLTNQNFNMS